MLGIDLFCGSGGMSLGAAMAGIDVRVAVDVDPDACATYRANHPAVKVLEKDVSEVKTILLDKREEPLVLFGGPPCQGFSTSNQRTRCAENDKNWLFLEFIRLVRELQPDVVVFENVAGILQTEGGTFVKSLIAKLRAAGYKITAGLINAVDVGVPQNRSRYFIVGSRRERPRGLLLMNKNAKQPNVRDALADLPPLENGADRDLLAYGPQSPSSYARLLRGRKVSCTGHTVSKNAEEIVARYAHIPQGGNWRDIPEDMMGSYSNRQKCHTGIYRRLGWEGPSVVIGNFRKNMLVHPEQDRGLSIREAARLQSFPDRYIFAGSIGKRQQQVGNAVPPLLAKAVFERVVADLQSLQAEVLCV